MNEYIHVTLKYNNITKKLLIPKGTTIKQLADSDEAPKWARDGDFGEWADTVFADGDTFNLHHEFHAVEGGVKVETFRT